MKNFRNPHEPRKYISLMEVSSKLWKKPNVVNILDIKCIMYMPLQRAFEISQGKFQEMTTPCITSKTNNHFIS